MRENFHPPETGGINATSSASVNCVSLPAYSQFRASRTVLRCAASAGNLPNNSVQSCSTFAGCDVSSKSAQPVTSLSWAKNSTRMVNKISTGGFQQQFSSRKNQHASQHTAESDATPATRAEMRAEQRADDGGQREPEQRPGVRDFFPARADE